MKSSRGSRGGGPGRRRMSFWSKTAISRTTGTNARAGLPDGLFSNQNPNLSKFWKAFNWKMFNISLSFKIFSGDLGYFMTIWYILYSFGTFFRFWYHVPRKIWQPCARATRKARENDKKIRIQCDQIERNFANWAKF
jgi:hypothetical protein